MGCVAGRPADGVCVVCGGLCFPLRPGRHAVAAQVVQHSVADNVCKRGDVSGVQNFHECAAYVVVRRPAADIRDTDHKLRHYGGDRDDRARKAGTDGREGRRGGNGLRDKPGDDGHEQNCHKAGFRLCELQQEGQRECHDIRGQIGRCEHCQVAERAA